MWEKEREIERDESWIADVAPRRDHCIGRIDTADTLCLAGRDSRYNYIIAQNITEDTVMNKTLYNTGRYM